MSKHLKIKNGVLSFLVVILLLSICYYLFYPCYTLGYSAAKVSRYTWDSAWNSAFLGSPDNVQLLYYNRFDNDYNYKAYLIYRYYDFILFVNDQKALASLDREVAERIICSDITDDDKPIIEGAFQRYQDRFLGALKSYHPSDEYCAYVCGALVAFCFIRFYNEVHDNIPMDRNEFASIFHWLKHNDKELKEHLEDPFAWRNRDFSSISDTKNLRNWIAFNINSEFIRDVEHYEEWVRKFRLFCDSFNVMKKSQLHARMWCQ